MLYFAYGSNMDWKQIKDRCPSVSFVCVAKLLDYKLDFTRKSEKRGCGVADVVKDSGSEVWGVVYKIDEMDIGKLDKAEGVFSNAYYRKEVPVYENDDMKKPLTVWIYMVVEKEFGKHKPNSDYKNQIVEGAKFWHLPEAYIPKLGTLEEQK